MIGGDFNTYLDQNLDKKGGQPEPNSRYRTNLLSLLEEFNLVNIWCLRNTSALKFTRRENTRAGLIQSRLDYFILSSHLAYQISNVLIKPGLKSDHSLLTLTFELLNTQKRGRGYWKFNNQLLSDEVYIKLIKDEIKQVNSDNNKLDNKNTMWDFVKCQLRTVTISYSISKRKKLKERENSLLKKIEKLEKDLSNTPQNFDEYNRVKEQWEMLENKKQNQ